MKTKNKWNKEIEFPETDLQVKVDEKVPLGELWVNPQDFKTLKNALIVIKKELQMYAGEE